MESDADALDWLMRSTSPEDHADDDQQDERPDSPGQILFPVHRRCRRAGLSVGRKWIVGSRSARHRLVNLRTRVCQLGRSVEDVAQRVTAGRIVALPGVL